MIRNANCQKPQQQALLPAPESRGSKDVFSRNKKLSSSPESKEKGMLAMMVWSSPFTLDKISVKVQHLPGLRSSGTG